MAELRADRRPLPARSTSAAGRTALYFEEAGQGIPLVCLHTAGADGRQFRHLLNDAEITRHFRVLAFDMPWHGKSLPPVGLAGRGVPAHHARLHRPDPAPSAARSGSSGRSCWAARSAARSCWSWRRLHAREFRALIGLESADYQAPWYDDTGWLHRPDVHGGEVARRDDVRADRAAEPERDALGHAVDVHAGRPRRVQGRSLLLSGRRRLPRSRRRDRHRARARSTC